MGFKGKVHKVQVKFIWSLKSAEGLVDHAKIPEPLGVLFLPLEVSLKKNKKWQNSRSITGVAIAVKQPPLLTIYSIYLSFIHVRWIPVQFK